MDKGWEGHCSSFGNSKRKTTSIPQLHICDSH